MGKAIVQSFSGLEIIPPNTNGKDVDKEISGQLGRLVSERVVNTIGLVGQEIRPDLSVASEKGKVEFIPAQRYSREFTGFIRQYQLSDSRNRFFRSARHSGNSDSEASSLVAGYSCNTRQRAERVPGLIRSVRQRSLMGNWAILLLKFGPRSGRSAADG